MNVRRYKKRKHFREFIYSLPIDICPNRKIGKMYFKQGYSAMDCLVWEKTLIRFANGKLREVDETTLKIESEEQFIRTSASLKPFSPQRLEQKIAELAKQRGLKIDPAKETEQLIAHLQQKTNCSDTFIEL